MTSLHKSSYAVAVTNPIQLFIDEVGIPEVNKNSYFSFKKRAN